MKLYCLRRFFSLLLKDEGLGENSGNNAGVVWCGVVWCGIIHSHNLDVKLLSGNFGALYHNKNPLHISGGFSVNT